MNSTAQSGAPDPKIVLAGVRALRWRIRSLMGDAWDLFSVQLDSLCAAAAEASGMEQQKLVDDLLRFGMGSPAGEVFEAIAAHAGSWEEMTQLTRELETKDRLETAEERYREARQQRDQIEPSDHVQRNAPPEKRRGPRAMAPEDLAFERISAPGGGYEEAAVAPSAEPDAADLSHGLKLPRRASQRKARGVATPKAKRAGRTKAKSAPRKKARSAGRSKVKRARPTKSKRAAPRRRMVAPRVTEERRPRTVPRKPRFVNLNFTDANGRVIRKKKPLVAKHNYKVRVGIGDLEKESVVENPVENPLRDDLLPPRAEGHWLQVAAVSDQFKIPRGERWLFLPTEGAAWSCKCAPGGAHKCRRGNRRKHVEFSVRAPSALGRAALRITVYFQKSILQSLLMSATIARTAHAPGSQKAVVDYNLTSTPADLELVRPRALSVMMNEGEDGSHTMVFNGAPKDVVAVRLTDGQMTAAVTMMREVMRTIHIEDKGPNDSDKVNLYDSKNGKSREKFIADLKELASRGYTLWHSLWQDKVKLWRKYRDAFVGDSDIIQIARKEWSTSVFPWAMVYGIPIDIGAPENNHLCRLLAEKEWSEFQKTEGDVPSRCPYESTHGNNVICPYGLWGIRYEIEQPPSVQEGQSLPRIIPVDPPPLNLVVALSDDLDAGLAATHLKALRAQHKAFTIRECRTRNEIRDGLGIVAIEVVYFYCHGYTNPLPGSAASTPSLGVGRKQIIAPPDLTTWLVNDWREDHWQATAPLVFINGCHTADTTPQTLVNFVDTFSASLDAAGVIGTEITVHQLVANEVAQTFLKVFQRGDNVGKALRQTRGTLLRKGNLLGLVYTAYCSAELRLSAGVP